MNKFVPIIVVASFTLIGVIVGSWLTYYFQVRAQEKGSLLEQRTSAYATFYNAQVLNRTAKDLLAAGRDDEAHELKRKFQRLDHQARFEVAVFGTRKVIKAMADYFRKYYEAGPCSASRQKKIADLEMYKAMREEFYRGTKEEVVPPKDLTLLLFYCELPPENEK